MPAYLFLWNPSKDLHSFRKFDEIRRDAAKGKAYKRNWICPSRQPREGDVAFVQRTGAKGNGVFARGVVIRAPFDDGDTRLVTLALNRFLEMGSEIPRPAIVARARIKQRWMPMASGNRLPDAILGAIESLWNEAEQPDLDSGPADAAAIADELVGLEGERLSRLTTHLRRERRLRERKISEALRRYGRLICEVKGCEFDFEAVYGEIGRGYAQVHHLQPLGRQESPGKTRLADLAIVCANCHAIVHRGGECRSLVSLISRA